MNLPTAFSWTAMMERAYDYDIHDIYVQDLDGSNEAANEFLDFTVEKTVSTGLEHILFKSWKPSVTTIE